MYLRRHVSLSFSDLIFCNSLNTNRSTSIKCIRSVSTTSDQPIMSKPPHEDTPALTPKSISMPAPPVPPPKSSSSHNQCVRVWAMCHLVTHTITTTNYNWIIICSNNYQGLQLLAMQSQFWIIKCDCPQSLQVIYKWLRYSTILLSWLQVIVISVINCRIGKRHNFLPNLLMIPMINSIGVWVWTHMGLARWVWEMQQMSSK